jgi:glycosyltransferase involved in cell wall biosynthesis
LGWVEDPALYARILSASDVLLMPSTAEAFGLMALEAMAAGRPVVSFEGTAIPFVTHAPECGVAVPMGDSAALRAALDMLVNNPRDAQERGRLGRRIARERFDHNNYLDRIAGLYRDVFSRQR